MHSAVYHRDREVCLGRPARMAVTAATAAKWPRSAASPGLPRTVGRGALLQAFQAAYGPDTQVRVGEHQRPAPQAIPGPLWPRRPRRYALTARGRGGNAGAAPGRLVDGVDQRPPQGALSPDKPSHRVGATVAGRQLPEVIVAEGVVRHWRPLPGRVRQPALDVSDQLEQIGAVDRRIVESCIRMVTVRIQAAAATGNDRALAACLGTARPAPAGARGFPGAARRRRARGGRRRARSRARRRRPPSASRPARSCRRSR